MRSENGWGEAQESAWQAFARGRVEQEGRGAKGSEGERIGGENCEEGRSIISKGRGYRFCSGSGCPALAYAADNACG